ncbi:predicted protein [Sclerotinia sclerotiorum 1980 UF-70]|uniref:Uncharacterized protein n=2 Tax=Sclerotinia sclerotiorum (strain ATCC 18683 / 1980 / Ss-1) TaxID=665079 RepID=A7EE74_SCLS1|nr:predicted protein [Sclerotinia sclerotiorum 1980 UF-70]APA10764.1 hypothetical protein sscle_07g055340 [Sclerotinia sclerotiorum 1980 UF-70]EDO01140.1 predicted protein [Sclerotinia sclerotiorum 1980 UF-70]
MEEQTYTSKEGPPVATDHLVRLAEMFEKDLAIFTIDLYPPTGVSKDGLLEGVGRNARKIMSQRYGDFIFGEFWLKFGHEFMHIHKGTDGGHSRQVFFLPRSVGT